MKKLIALLLISLSATAMAQHHHHGYDRGWHHNPGWWIAPAVIGGAVVYAATRPQTVVVQQPQPVYQAPYGYHWESVLDANCNCYRNVLVPN